MFLYFLKIILSVEEEYLLKDNEIIKFEIKNETFSDIFFEIEFVQSIIITEIQKYQYNKLNSIRSLLHSNASLLNSNKIY